MEFFTDYQFVNNVGQTTKLGFVILLSDGSGMANVMNFSSYKKKRIVRSVLGDEAYAFEDRSEAAYILWYDLEEILKRRIPMTIMTDSESLFRVNIKVSVTTGKRLMIEVRDACEAYKNGEISD